MVSKLLNIKEAAEYLGISANTLYQWVNQRKIKYIKIGRLLKFFKQDLDEFIESNVVKPIRSL